MLSEQRQHYAACLVSAAVQLLPSFLTEVAACCVGCCWPLHDSVVGFCRAETAQLPGGLQRMDAGCWRTLYPAGGALPHGRTTELMAHAARWLCRHLSHVCRRFAAASVTFTRRSRRCSYRARCFFIATHLHHLRLHHGWRGLLTASHGQPHHMCGQCPHAAATWCPATILPCLLSASTSSLRCARQMLALRSIGGGCPSPPSEGEGAAWSRSAPLHLIL